MCALLTAATSVLGCSTEPDSVGQLIVSFETDMALPKQIDTLQISVLVRGMYSLNQQFAVGSANDYHVPATLTLKSGGNPTLPVTVRVAGMKEGKFRTFRELITTVPTDRSAMARMPVQWLCTDLTKSIDEDTGTGVKLTRGASTCDDKDNTCVQGSCVPEEIKEPDLPNFVPADVFGGSADPKDGTCFDTVACMIKGRPVEPMSDGPDCYIERPDGDQLNVALRVAGNGICDQTGTVCFVPLDAENNEGWMTSGARIQLPRAVCPKHQKGVISAVYVSDACEPKNAGIPPCGEWSSVPANQAILPPLGGPAARPTPEQLVAVPIGDTKQPCCPLTQDAGKLYTCVCERDSKTSATVFEIDPAVPSVKPLGTVNLPADRQDVWFYATAFNGSLYWATPSLRQIQRTPLQNGTALAQAFPLPAAGAGLYESASVLVDASAIYTLVSGVSQASPVQVLVLGNDGAFKPSIDTGATKAVYQLDQDERALYVPVLVDPDLQPLAATKSFMRMSRVVRIDKQDPTQRSNVLPERSVLVQDKQEEHLSHGGYVGVQVDGNTVFSLFENARAVDNTIRVELSKADLSQPAGAAKTLYESTYDPDTTQVTLLGVVDGSAVVARTNKFLSTEGDTQVRTSSLMSVSGSDGSVRILADFAPDEPLPTLAADSGRVYWLNTSGRVYALTRMALR